MTEEKHTAKRITQVRNDDYPDGCIWAFIMAVFVIVSIPLIGAVAIVVLLWRWALGA